jgi:hypothetical protein
MDLLPTPKVRIRRQTLTRRILKEPELSQVGKTPTLKGLTPKPQAQTPTPKVLGHLLLARIHTRRETKRERPARGLTLKDSEPH